MTKNVLHLAPGRSLVRADLMPLWEESPMKTLNPIVGWVTLAFATLVLAPALRAEEPSRPCASDIQKFCKDVKPGQGNILRCLKEHEAELSAECKAHGEQAKERLKEAHEACSPDIEKFCKDVKPGQGRILRCLKEHESELSQACRESRSRARGSKRGGRPS